MSPSSARSRRIVGGVLLAVVAFCLVSLASYSSADSPDRAVAPRPAEVQNLCGKAGAYVASGLLNAVGVSAPILLASLAFVAVAFWRNKSIHQPLLRLLGLFLIVIGVSGLASIALAWGPGPLIGPGGCLGATLSFLLVQQLAPLGVAWLLACCLVSGLVLAADDLALVVARSTTEFAHSLMRRLRTTTVDTVPDETEDSVEDSEIIVRHPRVLGGDDVDTDEEFEDEEVFTEEPHLSIQSITSIESITVHDTSRHPRVLGGGLDNTPQEDAIATFAQATPAAFSLDSRRVRGNDETLCEQFPEDEVEDDVPNETEDEIEIEVDGVDTIANEAQEGVIGDVVEEFAEEDVETEPVESAPSPDLLEQLPPPPPPLPPLEALTEGEPFDEIGYESSVLEQASQLQQAFADFGFKIEVANIQTGPVIGQFEIQLEKGLRLNKIMGLTDDLAIALKVQTVRIVAPIPGRNTVGVEIPNAMRRVVRLRDVMEQGEAIADTMAIPVFLGQDATGQPLVVDLAKLPHLLIAGRTGTGKSVCLNSIIVSILMTRRSDEVRLLMIDPKMVELSPYKTIPHLMHPVVTDMRKAEAILGWAVEKMEDRYRMLARAGVRQLSEYNRLTEPQLYKRTKPESDADWNDIPKSMPYVVIVADELADLMMTAGKEVESHIIRLAQKSRAVGIHLVLATQKPTVDIITGLIKSNLPARIAFQVASRSDSQVVLDRNGAEKLLGNGDMLFLQPGTSLVERGQGTYVSDDDIERVIEMVSQVPQEFAEELVALEVDAQEAAAPPKEARDAIYEQAVECIISEGKGSVSLLQRKLEIGYGRAARIIDAMETDGIVGTSQGAQPREVLMTLFQWHQRQTSSLAPPVSASSPVAASPSRPASLPQVYSPILPPLAGPSISVAKTATDEHEECLDESSGDADSFADDEELSDETDPEETLSEDTIPEDATEDAAIEDTVPEEAFISDEVFEEEPDESDWSDDESDAHSDNDNSYDDDLGGDNSDDDASRSVSHRQSKKKRKKKRRRGR